MPPKACWRSSSSRSGASNWIFSALVGHAGLQELASQGSGATGGEEGSRSKGEASQQGPSQGRQISGEAACEVHPRRPAEGSGEGSSDQPRAGGTIEEDQENSKRIPEGRVADPSFNKRLPLDQRSTSIDASRVYSRSSKIPMLVLRREVASCIGTLRWQ